MNIRHAGEQDVSALARIWHGGWQDAHARILPAEIARHRTLESFEERVRKALPRVCVAEAGEVLGFHIVNNDELYQFYADPRALPACQQRDQGSRTHCEEPAACAVR